MRLIFGALIIFLAYVYHYEVNGTELRCRCLHKKWPPNKIILGNYWLHRDPRGPGCDKNEHLLYPDGRKPPGPGVCLSPDHLFSKWLDERNDNRWYNVNITKSPEPRRINITLIGVRG
uniref:Ul146 n=1 Tax=Human cytomegalovirus TaxID=10359 RepID=G8HSD9_HCMV|nr:ul146 [Human betaherpesvirus 5]